MALTAVEHLVGMIVSELQNEASLLLGVHDELRELSTELESMKSFLKDAETKQLKSEGENTWVANVRDLAYLSEDIIDDFMYNLHRQQCGGHFTRHFRSLICIPKHLWMTHQIATKLQHINKSIKAIPERSQRYGIDRLKGSTDAHNTLFYQRDAALFIKEEDVVGLKDESQQLERWLMDDGEFQQTLISVVGMGGSGKTTLVTRTYNKETVKHRFDCYGWVTVSQTYTREELFRSLIKEFYQGRKEQTPDLTLTDFKELVTMLMNYLEQKRYLAVLDDVWDTNLWEAMKVAFPENHLGSRIIMTTRKEDVGSFSSGFKNHILHIQPLKYTEAWDLFARKAFLSYPNKCCPTELQKTAWELVEKCKGLPLAIVTMGGLMSSKKSITEWTDVYNNLNWQLSNNPMLEAVKSILLLSFIDLPYPLKHCFLFCCLFPEDYMIRRKRLIRLWVAEGFVPQAKDRASPKQVAEGYLMELIFRSMLQVVYRNEFGRPKACKMHDLLRELALSISEKEKFCTVYDGSIGMERCINARRISIENGDGDLESYRGTPQIRSLLVSVSNSISISTTLLSKLKLLRVFDLEGVMIDKLPTDLGILFNLRYLNLRETKVAELPKSIQRLHNLETLDIRDTLIKVLPKGVAKLQNLQHLIMYRYNRGHEFDFQYVNGTRALFQMNKLKKLEVMSFVEAEGNVITQLGMMTQLRRMGISNLRQEDGINLCSSIRNLKKLQYLFLMVSGEEEFLGVDALESPPPYLHTLILAGKLERVPHWFCSLENLTFLYLHWSRMKEDLLPHIAELPNLGRLELTYAYMGGELHFSKGFNKLTKLYLFNFPQVTVISVEKEVMPDLQVMYLGTCTSLTALPQGIEFLTNLETLALPFSLRKERFKVQHIPNVYVW